MANKVTYADSTTIVRSVVEAFDTLSFKEAPFLKYISGGSEDAPSLNSLSEPCTAMKFEWLEDTDPPVSTTLAATITNSATTLTVTSADTAYVNVGDILLIDSEQFLVTANSGTVLTVTGGWGSTTRAAHTGGAVGTGVLVYIVGTAHIEGADAPASSYMYPTMPYNLVQELTETVQLSELEQAIKRFGVDNAVEYETAKKMRRLTHLLERQCFYGKQVVGTSTVPPAFGGLDTYITASSHVKDLSGGSLAVDDLEDLMQACYVDTGMVGTPDCIVCGPFQRRQISKIYSTAGVTVYRDQSARRGGVLVDVVDTHFGSVDIVMTNWCDPASIYLLKKDKLGIGPVEGKEFTRTMLAKTGTSDKWMISGDYTFQVRASKMHARIANAATS